MVQVYDFLVLGSGLAGLSFARKVAKLGRVAVIAKADLDKTNTSMAQGGVSAVMANDDSFQQHIQDTLIAGAGLCQPEIVKNVVEQAPDRMQDLWDWGVSFDLLDPQPTNPLDHKSNPIKDLHLDLTKEGGHSKRRILHVQDKTGFTIQKHLLQTVQQTPNIDFFTNHIAIDLITTRKLKPREVVPNRCDGAFVLDKNNSKVIIFKARATILATGGAGKAYLYTSNWDGATGDGVALAYRAGARVANLEFMQFHPTCLYHPQARNFLISEALRGEGARLINQKGEEFMDKYHPAGALAPRDIVARSIDSELKKSGDECVYLDISHRRPEFIHAHFPQIAQKCLELGIDITKAPIPVVPAAHYLCGGVLTDIHGKTDLNGLFAIGETGATGLHGANRLASNSLLECLALAHNAATWCEKHWDQLQMTVESPPEWVYRGNIEQDEMTVIHHIWDEIRRLMWNYVGIVRTNKRLLRAQARLRLIQNEIQEYYWNYTLHSDILELRNLALFAELTVRCALKRHESRGIHFNLDYPFLKNKIEDSIIGPDL